MSPDHVPTSGCRPAWRAGSSTLFRFGRHGWVVVDARRAAPLVAPPAPADLSHTDHGAQPPQGTLSCTEAAAAPPRRIVGIVALIGALAAAAGEGQLATGKVVEGVACSTDPTKTYSLYLPTAYTPERRWPVLLIFPPGGSSTTPLELFRPAAETYGWIVLSSDDTRSGGVPMEVNAQAVRALGGELGTRWAADMRRVYAAGFSGGAMVAWLLGTEPGLLAGVIACGGLFVQDYFTRPVEYAHFGAVGTRDFNYRNMRLVDRRLAELGALHRVEFFDGPHRWPPADLATEAVAWMELVAMKRGLRPRDDAMIAAALSAESVRAEEAEQSGDPLTALRRYETIAATFSGLADVSTPRAAADRLARSAGVRRALRDEEREDSFEIEYAKTVARTVRELRDREVPMPLGKLAGDLRLAELEKAAAEDDVHALTAERMLQAVLFHLTSEVASDMRAAKRFRDYASVMTLAARIAPTNAAIAYNLACSHALAGEPGEAMRALERAVELGFRDASLLATDTDLDALRSDERFVALTARAGT